MEDWLDGAAAALGEEGLDPEEVRLVLRLAREVAHGVERRMAPLASYLAGVAAGRDSAFDGGAADRLTALRIAAATIRRSVPGVGEADDAGDTGGDDGSLSARDPEPGPRGPTAG